MNYGKQTNAYPQRLNQMLINWDRFVSFDDTNRKVNGLLGIIPETLGMCDNHNNREAFFLSQTSSSPAHLRFNTLRYSRDGANLDSTLKTFTISLLPDSLPGTSTYPIGGRKISDSQYKLYFIGNPYGTYDVVLYCWTFYLTNQDTFPYTGSYIEDEVATLTIETGDSYSAPIVLGSKAYIDISGPSATKSLMVADIEAESLGLAEDFYPPTNPTQYWNVWYQTELFGKGYFLIDVAPDYEEEYWREAVFNREVTKDHSGHYARADYFYQITGDHYKFDHHRWINRYIDGSPPTDEYYHTRLIEQDGVITGYTIELVAEETTSFFEHQYDPDYDVVYDTMDPRLAKNGTVVLFNRGINGIVLYDAEYHLYNIDEGYGAVVEPPLNCIFYYEPLNCIDDISDSLYMLAVDEFEGTINLLTVDGDGEVGINRVIDSDFRYSSETHAVNYGNFIFTFQNISGIKTNGHLIYFCDDIDGASQVIMLPEIQ